MVAWQHQGSTWEPGSLSLIIAWKPLTEGYQPATPSQWFIHISLIYKPYISSQRWGSSIHWTSISVIFHPLPSGYVKIAIENDHRNSGFSHKKWWFSIAFCMFTRPGKWTPRSPHGPMWPRELRRGWRLWSWVPLRPWRTAFCGSGRCCQVGVETPRNGGWNPQWNHSERRIFVGVPKKKRDHRGFVGFLRIFLRWTHPDEVSSDEGEGGLFFWWAGRVSSFDPWAGFSQPVVGFTNPVDWHFVPHFWISSDSFCMFHSSISPINHY